MTEKVKHHDLGSNSPTSLPLMPDQKKKKNLEVKVVSLNKSISKYPEGKISAGALKKKSLLKRNCEKPISASDTSTCGNGRREGRGSVINRSMMDGP